MRFLLLSLITYIDRSKTPQQRLREVVDAAVLGAELGFAPALHRLKGR